MQRARSLMTTLTVAGLVGLAWTTGAVADGAVNLASCQTLSSPNTTYKLIADLASSDDCLIVSANKVTIDLQGHSITGPGSTSSSSGITDLGETRDVIVIRNGTISQHATGISMVSSRLSVIGVTATANGTGISVQGSQALVKSSTASSNALFGIFVAEGDRAQVQQSTANNNGLAGIVAVSNNCLVTMNTANGNGHGPGVPGVPSVLGTAS